MRSTHLGPVVDKLKGGFRIQPRYANAAGYPHVETAHGPSDVDSRQASRKRASGVDAEKAHLIIRLEVGIVLIGVQVKACHSGSYFGQEARRKCMHIVKCGMLRIGSCQFSAETALRWPSRDSKQRRIGQIAVEVTVAGEEFV